MKKRENFIIISLMLLFLAIGNILIYFRRTGIKMIGLAVSEIPDKLVKLDRYTIIFVVQWFLIFLVIIIFSIKFLKKRKAEKIKDSTVKIIRKKGTTTDLDVLYNLLRQRKNLKISIIAKTFKINNEKALEWCKILENHNLANIEYFSFTEPEVKVV